MPFSQLRQLKPFLERKLQKQNYKSVVKIMVIILRPFESVIIIQHKVAYLKSAINLCFRIKSQN